MFQKTTLKNGLRVLTSSMPGSFSVGICALVKVGSRYENEKNAGITHFSEHMFLKGSRKWPSQKDLSFIIEGSGAYFNGLTSKELTLFEIQIPKEKAIKGIEILLDMVLYSQIKKEDFEKEKGVINQEINRRYDSPQGYIWNLIDETMWSGNSLGQNTAGYKETIQKLQTKDLREFFEKFYIPQNMVISAAGNINHQDFVKNVEKFFDKKFEERKGKLEFLPLKEKQKEPNLKIEFRKTEQSHFILGVKTFDINHPDKFILNVINSLLGVGWSSRLMLNIRSQKGLAYSIHSGTDYLSDTGRLIINSGVKNEMISVVMKEVVKELKRFKKEKVSDSELTQAKEKIKGRFLFGVELPEDQAEWYGRQELFQNKIFRPEEILAKIDKVSSEDILKVAQKLFVSKNLSLALIGPFKEKDKKIFKEILKKID
jgi:predicted Zn-dependent peptidase